MQHRTDHREVLVSDWRWSTGEERDDYWFVFVWTIIIVAAICKAIL